MSDGTSVGGGQNFVAGGGVPGAPPPQRSNTWLFLGVGVLILIIGVLAGVLLVNKNSDKTASTTTTTSVDAQNIVSLEPINHSGANPFLPPVGNDHKGVTPPPHTNGSFAADTPGLYGGTMHEGSCNPKQLVTFLNQNPDKALAWATTLGISVKDIPDYVSGLTPVILRTATSVTNHGYVNGKADAIPAVLQPGTAVLVDKYGQPVTKCYCGNPLTAPATYSAPSYVGPRWSGFSPTSITIIQKTTVVIQEFTMVDINTNQTFTRPAGTTGSEDTPSSTGIDTDTGSVSTDSTPTTTTDTSPPITSPQSETTTSPETTTTTAPGPSPQDQAKAKLQAAASQCYPFPAPIQDSTSQSVNTIGDGQTFTLEVVDQTVSGGTQTFDWSVDRNSLKFTPQNDLATVASNHCPGLN